MSKWKTYRLGDIIQLKSGGTPDKSNPDYWGGSIPWISAKSMYDDFISTSDLFITEEGLQAGSKIAKKDSILLLTRGSGLFNRIPVCYVVSDVAYNQDVKNIVLKQEDVTSIKFLYYWLYGNKELLSSMLETTGIGAGKIDTKRFLNLSISLPSQKEQARYIHLMDLLFDKIELNRRINANLEAQAQALFRSWFVDFEPFRDGPFVDSELGKIPQGWKVGSLLDIAELFDYKRKPLSSREREKMQKIYPYYGATSIMDFVDNYIFDGIYLLMGEDGSVANAHGYPYLQYVFGKFWPNNHAHVMQGKNGYTTEMLHCLLLKKNITSIVTGAVQPKISQANMKKILVPLAPDKICSAFADLISPIYSTRRNSEKEISNLSALRDTLLPKLMAGEINLH